MQNTNVVKLNQDIPREDNLFTDNQKEQLFLYKQLKETADSTLGVKSQGFKVYMYDLEETLKIDIKNENVKIIKTDEEFHSSRLIMSSKNEARFDREFNDKILHYDKFEVVIGSIRRPSETAHYDFEYTTYLFAKDKEIATKFFEYVATSARELHISDYSLLLSNKNYGLAQEKLPIDKKISTDKLYLEEEVKKEILFSINSFFNKGSEVYEKLNIPYRRGILLYGKPGNGKTTLLKAISNTIEAPVVYWQVSERSDSESIDSVFNKVSQLAPALLIIEDIDSLPPSCRSTFLNQLDGAKTNSGIFIIGTTNFPEKIDPAMMNRAGRFDRTYEIKSLTKKDKVKYFMDKGLHELVSMEEVERISEITEDFSISLLSEIYTSIALSNVYGEEINVDKIIESFKSVGSKQATNFINSKTNKIGFQAE